VELLEEVEFAVEELLVAVEEEPGADAEPVAEAGISEFVSKGKHVREQC
jgi:hypothetical protein